MYLQKVKGNKIFIKNKLFFVSILKVEKDPEPDPEDSLVRGTDPQIRIHTKISRIQNTVGICRNLRNGILFARVLF